MAIRKPIELDRRIRNEERKRGKRKTFLAAFSRFCQSLDCECVLISFSFLEKVSADFFEQPDF